MRYQFGRLNTVNIDKYIDEIATGECQQAKLINNLSQKNADISRFVCLSRFKTFKLCVIGGETCEA